MIHNQHIGIYENIFSKEWCNNVISTAKNITSNFTKNIEYRNNFSLSEDVSFALDDYNEDIPKEFCKEFYNKCFLPYTKKYKLHSSFIHNLYLSAFKFQKTNPTEGYHLWHYEQAAEYPSRWGVYMIYLNDIEEGGETEFLEQKLRISPKSGTVCIFPGGYTHLHRGNPPLSQSKYVITGWIEYYYGKIGDQPNPSSPEFNHGLKFKEQFSYNYLK
jgi:hypothetical protein